MSAVTLASVQDVDARLRSTGYLPSPEIATSVFLADRLEKPILVEGPAGVGKTELARAFAQATGRRLFLLPRPVLAAIRSADPALLLVDEIDKADPEFEAFLLEVLADYSVTVPEIGTVRALHTPRVVLTSNAARELSDALKRRCLHLYIDFPSAQRELEIVRGRVPGVADQLARKVVAAVQAIRKLDLKKLPSIAETLDWIRALLLLNASSLDPQLVSDTLSTLLKYEADIAKAREHVGYIASADLPATVR